MSNYLVFIKQWCEDIIHSLDESLNRSRNARTGKYTINGKRFHSVSKSLLVNGSQTEQDVYRQATDLRTNHYLFTQTIFPSKPSTSGRKFRRWSRSAVTPPAASYRYEALEPYINQEIMRLHHQKHHQSYVTANKAERKWKSPPDGRFDLIKHWEREAAFNGAGHYLHTIFGTI